VTSAPEASLTVRTARSAGWVIAWRMLTRILGLISTVVLTKLLLPGDFGLVALATSFALAVDGLSELGVGEALTREMSLDRDMYDTGFTISFCRGLLTAAVIAMGAWPVAAFFGDPRLGTITLVLAVAMLLSSVENIGIVDFRRDLAFQKELQLYTVPRILGIAASITFAAIFANYWALIVGILTTRTTRCAWSYVMHPYRPHLTLRRWRQIIGFSSWTWANTIVDQIRERLDWVVIGRLLGTADTGIYAVGSEVGLLPSTELLQPFGRALYAGFAAARREGTGIAGPYLRTITTAFLLTMPAGFGISLVADPLVRLIFGEHWLAAVPLVEIFGVMGMLGVITNVSGALLTVSGMLSLQFRFIVLTTVVRLVLLLVLVNEIGIVGAGIAAAGTLMVEECSYLVVTFRRFHVRVADLWRGIWRPILATAAMAGVLIWQGLGWTALPGSPLVIGEHLALAVAIGASTYCAVIVLLWWLAGRPDGAEVLTWRLAKRSLVRQSA
jgi:lipopolysaccharide exporter